MARKIWRYTLTVQEQKLWDMEEMQGWRTAMTGCVEDEARENACAKFMIYDRKENLLTKGDVGALPQAQTVEL